MQQDKDKDRVTGASMNPRWWREEHTSAWMRIKEALRRDWEQTKHDFHKKAGVELHQGMGDTIKQMTGRQPVGDWTTVEPAMRFGYGAGSTFRDREFDAHESNLEREWNELHPARRWPEARDDVRHGWDWSRRKD